MLGCYNATDKIYLGERYGYRLLAPDGFNYITGGGGIVFSKPTIQKLVKECICPSDSSPDDMIVAVCLQRIGVEPIHSSRFHQVGLIKLWKNKELFDFFYENITVFFCLTGASTGLCSRYFTRHPSDIIP